jgi:hypothetical protein
LDIIEWHFREKNIWNRSIKPSYKCQFNLLFLAFRNHFFVISGIIDKSNGFFTSFFSMWTKVMVYFLSHLLFYKNFNLCLPSQAKRKRALLESNLSGTTLMDDKNVKSKGCMQHNGPLIFLESFMPLKTHL